MLSLGRMVGKRVLNFFATGSSKLSIVDTELPLGALRVIDQTEQICEMSQPVTLTWGTLHTLLAIASRQSISELSDRRGRERLLKDLVILLDLGLIQIDPPSESTSTGGDPWMLRRIVPSVPMHRQLADGQRRDLEIGTNGTTTRAANVPLTAESCPRLGILDDPASIYDRPSSHHRCFAGREPEAISTEEQSTLCLTGRYASCPHYIETVTSSKGPEHDDLDTTSGAVSVDPSAKPPDAPVDDSRSITTKGSDGHFGGATSDQNSGSISIDSAQPASAPESTHADSPVAIEAMPSAKRDAPTIRRSVSESRREAQSRAHPASRPFLAVLAFGFAAAIGAAWIFYHLPTVELDSDQQAIQERTTPDMGGAQALPPAVPVGPPVGGMLQQDPPAPSTVSVPATHAASTPTPSAGTVSVASTAVEQPDTISAVAASSSASPLPISLRRTVLAERFSKDGWRDWPNDPQGTARLVDGAYRVSAREPGRFVAIGAPGVGPLRDVVVSATFHKVGGPAGGGYGLILRDRGPGPRDGINQEGRYYVFEAGDQGLVGIWRRETDHWVDLQSWTQSEAVNRDGATNQLVVQAANSRLSFRVNGVQVASFDDPVLDEGGVGIFVGGDLNDVVVDEFSIQAPE